jgi:hypothetical protein
MEPTFLEPEDILKCNGKTFLSMDYSQMEIRVFAILRKDPNMLKARAAAFLSLSDVSAKPQTTTVSERVWDNFLKRAY